MSSKPIKAPRRFRLLLIGALALAGAGAIAAAGITSRVRATQELAQWSKRQAVPTVALAALTHDGAPQILRLPGAIQAYDRAELYARVSGYLKSWDQDIGAHVKKGQPLASVDTPDLDQQLSEAKADLASAIANSHL